MHPSTIYCLAALPAVFAQYGNSGSKTTATAAASSATSSSSIDGVHVVKVGDGGLTFDPQEITAAVGEVVEFHFYPMAHSVAQSNFSSPCQPINGTGFFSGPVKVSSGVSDTVFSMTIEDTNPKWFYCATGQHCQNGMVGVINAPTSGQNTIKAYAEAAADAASNVAPSSTAGGTLGKAATAAPTSAASSTQSSDSSAGIPTTGDIRWGLMALGTTVAAFIGGLML